MEYVAISRCDIRRYQCKSRTCEKYGDYDKKYMPSSCTEAVKASAKKASLLPNG